MKPLLAAMAVIVVLLILLMAGVAKAHPGKHCHTKACPKRVQVKTAHAKWRATVRRYGIRTLRARMRCESGDHGGYRLGTTGNGFWFAHQFEPRAWTGAGGRMRHGRPAGVWTMQPSRLEQDYRAVMWARRHGGDPWPNCP